MIVSCCFPNSNFSAMLIWCNFAICIFAEEQYCSFVQEGFIFRMRTARTRPRHFSSPPHCLGRWWRILICISNSILPIPFDIRLGNPYYSTTHQSSPSLPTLVELLCSSACSRPCTASSRSWLHSDPASRGCAFDQSRGELV